MSDQNGNEPEQPTEPAAADSGSAAELPSITVVWDATSQAVTLQFDVKQFRNWRFVEAILEMGVKEAEAQGQMMMSAAMRHQAQQQAQAAALASQLRGRR